MLLQSTKRPTTTRPKKSSVHHLTSSSPFKPRSTHRRSKPTRKFPSRLTIKPSSKLTSRLTIKPSSKLTIKPSSKLTSRLTSKLPNNLSSKFPNKFLGTNRTTGRPVKSLLTTFFSNFTSRILSVLPREHLSLYIILGVLVLVLLSVLFCCWCRKRPKSKANKTRRQIKIKSTSLLDPSKVSTSALNTTATETQNDETMSLTNMPIETDLIELKKRTKSDSKWAKRKGIEKLKKITSDHKVPSRIAADLQSELKSVYSRSSTLDKRVNQPDNGQLISRLSTGSEISAAATQRIQKFRESSKAMLIQSRHRSTAKGELSPDLANKVPAESKRNQSGELRRKLHRSRKSRAIMRSRVRASREGFRSRFKCRSSEASDADRSTEPNKDRSADSDRSNGTGSTERTENSETREAEDLKAKAIQSKRRRTQKMTKKNGNSKLKVLSKRQPKRLSRTKSEMAEGKLHSIKIYDKTIEFKKSNELISIFKQIPDLDASKLPTKAELFSPPSKSTLKKGKRIVSGISLSESSSEELIGKIKRYKVRPKEKIKTKSTEPLLDGEFH